jgi:hypothetical protein
MMRFFVGLHQPSDAHRFPAVMVSVNRLRDRKSGFAVNDWIMDSGAFTQLDRHGGYDDPPSVYAAEIKRWATNGNLLAAVSQDYMCEPFMLAKTGMTVADHQRLTIERYVALMACDLGGVYLMPVLQGYAPADYVDHIRQYGDRLKPGMWVGVGSVCKRNGDPAAIEEVLLAIKRARPDLRLHGFGIKTTALGSDLVRQLLETADSMAWSFAERMAGGNANHWSGAAKFVKRIATMPVQLSLLGVAR